MMVTIHEVDSIRDVKFGDKNFIFGLHHVSMLVFNNVADFAYLALTGSPNLYEALCEDLVS